MSCVVKITLRAFIQEKCPPTCASEAPHLYTRTCCLVTGHPWRLLGRHPTKAAQGRTRSIKTVTHADGRSADREAAAADRDGLPLLPLLPLPPFCVLRRDHIVRQLLDPRVAVLRRPLRRQRLPLHVIVHVVALEEPRPQSVREATVRAAVPDVLLLRLRGQDEEAARPLQHRSSKRALSQ